MFFLGGCNVPSVISTGRALYKCKVRALKQYAGFYWHLNLRTMSCSEVLHEDRLDVVGWLGAGVLTWLLQINVGNDPPHIHRGESFSMSSGQEGQSGGGNPRSRCAVGRGPGRETGYSTLWIEGICTTFVLVIMLVMPMCKTMNPRSIFLQL